MKLFNYEKIFSPSSIAWIKSLIEKIKNKIVIILLDHSKSLFSFLKRESLVEKRATVKKAREIPVYKNKSPNKIFPFKKGVSTLEKNNIALGLERLVRIDLTKIFFLLKLEFFSTEKEFKLREEECLKVSIAKYNK